MDRAQRRLTSGARALFAVLLVLAGWSCGGGAQGEPRDDGDGVESPVEETCDDTTLPYASELVRFTPGDAAGYGQSRLPDVVLGPPAALGPAQGSLDVVSLGVGGELVLGFGSRVIVDGEGPDLIVFENAFYVGGDPSKVWSELGEVAVSEDGETWHAWPCDAGASGPPWLGCAGWTPTQAFARCTTLVLAPEQTGGDAFDLAELGLGSARFVRVRDLASTGAAPSAGFDLDAVGLVNWEQR